MWFSFWLAKRSGSAGRGRSFHRKRPTCRPRLEALEDRWVPSQVNLTVTSLADSGPGTLRAAILAADAGSHSDKYTIDFSVTGTIDLHSPLPDLNNTIAVQGPGSSRLNVERAAGYSFSSAIVTVGMGQTASLSGLKVANGNAGGIVNGLDATLAITNCTISGNTAERGGGIANFQTMTIAGSIISGNSAHYAGGIYNPGNFGENNGILTITSSTVSGNTALDWGGGIGGDAELTISGSTIADNIAPGNGGGVYMDGGTLTISDSTIKRNTGFEGGGVYGYFSFASAISGGSVKDNTAELAGGGLFLAGLPRVTVSGSTLSSNSVTGFVFDNHGSPFIEPGIGGGICSGVPLTVAGCTLTGNSANGLDFGGNHYAGRGGGLFNTGATSVRDSLFRGNSGDLGGGIYNNILAELDVRSSVFTGRNSAAFGGGIYNAAVVYSGITYSGTLTVSGSTFSGNSASDSGGALYNAGAATLQQCTLSSNTAGSNGGGIFNVASGTLAVKDSTVLGNFALLGADLFNDHGSVTVNDSIIGDWYNA